ncbi:hypothetical protein OBG91_14500 [Lactococcus lactis]|nr:hypothetical protein [Lactococcus lactis]
MKKHIRIVILICLFFLILTPVFGALYVTTSEPRLFIIYGIVFFLFTLLFPYLILAIKKQELLLYGRKKQEKMVISEKIFLLTNEGVDYFIDTETYRLFTDSEQKINNVPQLVGVSGSIATVLGIIFKGNILMISPTNKIIVVLSMWLIIFISSILLPIYQAKRNKKIISSGRLVVKKMTKYMTLICSIRFIRHQYFI